MLAPKHVLWAPVALAIAGVFRLSMWGGVVGVVCAIFGYYLGARGILGRTAFVDLSYLIPIHWNRRKFARPEQTRKTHSDQEKLRSDSCGFCDQPDCNRSVGPGGKGHPPPWHGLELPQIVDEAVVEFIELTLRTYVAPWYEELSTVRLHVQNGGGFEKKEDPCFPHELNHQIRFLAGNILRRLNRLDLTEWILKKVVPLAISHGEVYSRIRTHFGHNATPEVLEQRVLDYIRPSGCLHQAMYSRKSELDYLRALADFLVSQLADNPRLMGKPFGSVLPAGSGSQSAGQINSARSPERFVRELVVFAFLLPVADIIADPDIINKILIIFFDPEPMKKFDGEPLSPTTEPLLALSASGPAQISDSLLQIKLSDIMNDPPQLYNFMNHLKVTKGPLNQLQFVMAAYLLIQRIGEYVREKSENTAVGEMEATQADDTQPDDATQELDSTQEEDVVALTQELDSTQDSVEISAINAVSESEGASHLHWESWELYRNYFHDGAPDQIPFPARVSHNFKVAVESPPEAAVPLIEAALTEAYQEVYHWLQYNHVIPFCQSEIFLENLSGNRPELEIRTEDRADGKENAKRLAKRRLHPGGVPGLHSSPSESGFTMNKFRNRLTGLFKASIEDGSFVSYIPPSPEASASPAVVSGSVEKPIFDVGMAEEEGLEPEEIDEDLIDLANLHNNSPHLKVYAMERDRWRGKKKWKRLRIRKGKENKNPWDEKFKSRSNSMSGESSKSGGNAAGQADSLSLASGGSADMTDLPRDLNLWKVSIPEVLPARDPSTQRTMYVYRVEVERRDVGEELEPEHPNRKWSVQRRYGEFYVLENKLLEFHGDNLGKLRIPPKKTFANKGRAFIENLRHDFEEFLQRCVCSKYLKGSELLFTFLTSEAEFTSSSFQDFNPFKAIRKVPGKLSREKGQHLAKFITNFVNSVDLDRVPSLIKSKSSPLDVRSESSGLSSLSFGDKGPAKEKLTATIFKNNYGLPVEDRVSTYSKTLGASLNGAPVRASPTVTGRVAASSGWAASGLAVVGSLFDLLLFLGAKVLHLARPAFLLLVSLRTILRDTVDGLVDRYLRYTLKQALHEKRVVELIEMLRDVLYYEENSPLTESERKARTAAAAEAARTFLLTELPRPAVWALGGRQGFGNDIQTLFEGLQHPRLNKQLFYVLLDQLVQDIFPELELI